MNAQGTKAATEILASDAPLRDYFAALALQGMLPVADSTSVRLNIQEHANDYARVAYWLADAMLKQRAKALG